MIKIELDETVAQLIMISLRDAEDSNIGEVRFDHIEPNLEKRRTYFKQFHQYNGDSEVFEDDEKAGDEFIYVSPNDTLGMLWRAIHDAMEQSGLEIVGDTFDPYDSRNN